MTEPDQVEFHERITAERTSGARSLPVRIGVVAGSAALVLVGAVAAMGASPAAPATGATAQLSAAVAPAAGTLGVLPMDRGMGAGMRGAFGPGGFRDITIGAINGSSLSLKTDDGWTRTITLGSSTAITKGGQTIAVGDLAVGDQVQFGQTKGSDGTYTITALRVVLPVIGGQVTAVSGTTITVTGRDGTTGTIHVDGKTTYDVDGTTGKALSDITVGSFVIAEGALRADGSLDAAIVHSGMHGPGDGHRGGPGFMDRHGDPDVTPAPTPASAS